MNRLGVSRWLQGLLGAAVVIAGITVFSRLLGFARWIAQANQVGTTEVGTAYAAANTLPNILFEVAAGGALAGVIVPVLAGVFARKDYATGSTLASAILTWTVTILLPLGVVVALAAEHLVALLPIGADPNGAISTLTVFFLRTFAVQLPLYGLAVLFGGILQAQKKFVWPALSPAISSVVVIIGYFCFGALADGQQNNAAGVSQQALNWLAWSTNAGVAAMALCMVLPVWRSGVRLKLRWRMEATARTRILRLAAAGIGALLVQQASILVVMVVALKYGEVGTLNIYQYAQAVYFLPYAVLAVPLATSAFPRIAASGASDPQVTNRILAKTTATIVAVSLAGAAALIAVAGHLEEIFELFTVGGAQGMSTALTWMAPGLVGYALIFHISRCLYSFDAGGPAAWSTVLGWVVVIGLAFGGGAWAASTATSGPDQALQVLRVLGLANACGMSLAGMLLLAALVRRCGREVLAGVGRTSVLTALALAAYIGLVKLLDSPGQGNIVVLILQAAALAAGSLGIAAVVVVSQRRRARDQAPQQSL